MRLAGSETYTKVLQNKISWYILYISVILFLQIITKIILKIAIILLVLKIWKILVTKRMSYTVVRKCRKRWARTSQRVKMIWLQFHICYYFPSHMRILFIRSSISAEVKESKFLLSSSMKRSSHYYANIYLKYYSYIS